MRSRRALGLRRISGPGGSTLATIQRRCPMISVAIRTAAELLQQLPGGSGSSKYDPTRLLLIKRADARIRGGGLEPMAPLALSDLQMDIILQAAGAVATG